MSGLLKRLALTPPDDPREVQAWLDGLANAIAADVARVLRGAVETALEAFSRSLTAGGDLTAIDGVPAAWKGYVDDELADVVASVHSAGSLTAWIQAPGTDAISEAAASKWAAVVNEAAVDYMRAATNRLVGVGNQVWATVRGIAVDALERGLTGPELMSAIQAATSFTEFRADTVGRTETQAAYNGGDYEGARALGDDGPVEKFWMAALDNRTREDHADADGQTVKFDDPFIVGGEQMQYPLDPSGSPEQVVNCRCVTGFLYEGDERPDGSVVGKDELDG